MGSSGNSPYNMYLDLDLDLPVQISSFFRSDIHMQKFLLCSMLLLSWPVALAWSVVRRKLLFSYFSHGNLSSAAQNLLSVGKLELSRKRLQKRLRLPVRKRPCHRRQTPAIGSSSGSRLATQSNSTQRTSKQKCQLRKGGNLQGVCICLPPAKRSPHVPCETRQQIRVMIHVVEFFLEYAVAFSIIFFAFSSGKTTYECLINVPILAHSLAHYDRSCANISKYALP